MFKSGMQRQREDRIQFLNENTNIPWGRAPPVIKSGMQRQREGLKNKDYVWKDEPGKTDSEKMDSFIRKHGGYKIPPLSVAGGGPSRFPLPGKNVEIPIIVPSPLPSTDYGTYSEEQKEEAVRSGRFAEALRDHAGIQNDDMLSRQDRFFRSILYDSPEMELTPVNMDQNDIRRGRVDTDDEDSDDEWARLRRRRPGDPDDDPNGDPGDDPDGYSGDKKPRPKGPSKIKKIIAGGLGAGAASAAAYKLKGGKTEDPKLPPSVPTDPTKGPDGGLPPTPAKRPVKSPPSPVSVDVPTNTTDTSRRVYRIPDDPNASYSGGRIEESGPSPAVHKTDEALNMKSTEDRSAATAAAAAATDTSTDKSKDNLHQIEEEMMGGYIGKRGFWHYPRRAKDHFNQEGLIYNSAIRKRQRL